MTRLLEADLRGYRDRVAALAACAAVSLMLAFGLLPGTARADETPPTQGTCTGVDGSQGPLFFLASSNSDATLQPTPASGSTVHPGDTVYAVYHDETPLLDASGNTVPGPSHHFSFKITAPDTTKTDIAPTFTTVAAGTGFGTMLPAHDDAWIPTASNSGIHPDQEFNHIVKISGKIPSSLTAIGDYSIHLETFDGDNQDGGDCGSADWKLHLTPAPVPTPSTSPASGTQAASTAPALPRAGVSGSGGNGASAGIPGALVALLLSGLVAAIGGRWLVLRRRSEDG